MELNLSQEDRGTLSSSSIARAGSIYRIAATGAISGLLTREAIDLAGIMVMARQQHWLTNIPLFVLARHRTADELPPGISADRRAAIQHMTEQEQQDLASRSPRGRLIWVDGTSHYIQQDAPGKVIEAIDQVLAAAWK